MRRGRRVRGVALVLIDVINAFDFPGSGPLAKSAVVAARAIEQLANRARLEGIPVVYVNDNFGRWRSNFNETVHECRKQEYAGSEVTERLRPMNDDYFVLKPQHSGFYLTPLEQLLDHLKIHTIVLAGFATNICVAFTANDAHMRGFRIVAPRDCSAANTKELHRSTLLSMRCALAAETPPASEVDFKRLSRGRRKSRGQPFGDSAPL